MTTPAQLRKALGQLAGIIERSPTGDKYWPIFERLEAEAKTHDSRSARLAAARMMEARV